MGRCIIVLGAHRSGTSAVAGMLARLGVNMGKKLKPGDGSNPLGFYEDQDWLDLSNDLIKDWRDVNIESIPEPAQARYRELVERMGSEPIWGVKDPRLCLLMKWVAPLVGDLRIVATRRKFTASLASLVVKYPEQPEEYLELALSACLVYRSKFLAGFSGPVLWIDYNRLMDHPQEVVHELAQFGFDGMAAPNPDLIRKAVEFARPSLRHHE